MFIENNFISSKNHFWIKMHTKPTPSMPNLFATFIIAIKTYKKTHLKIPQSLILKGFFIPNILYFVTRGDIELNPGPMPDILRNHPSPHKKRNKTYFISKTINLQSKYRHSAKIFVPLLLDTHLHHYYTIISHPILHQYIQICTNHFSTHILYTLIIIINQLINVYNNTYYNLNHYLQKIESRYDLKYLKYLKF